MSILQALVFIMSEKFSGDYISWLKTFYELAQSHSFSSTAEIVGRSQSTVTYQVKKLEERLGVELVNRRAKPLQLTSAGEQLYILCQKFFSLLQQINDQINGGEEVCGNIVIAANYGLTTYYLPAKINEFKKLYPQVNIEVKPQPIGELLKSYYSPEVDILITQENVVPEIAQKYFLFKAEMALVSPANWNIQINDPPKLEDFIHLPFVAFWKDYPFDLHVRKVIQEAGYSVKIEQYGSFFLPILMYVSLGRGVAVMDEFQARTPGFNVNVHSLKQLFPSRNYAIIHRPRQYISPATQKFINFLIKNK